MKTLTQFIEESSLADAFDYAAYFDSALGYKRSQMPQIYDEHFDDVLLHLSSKYKVKKQKISVDELLPTQNEVNVEKINSKLNSIDLANLKFITSNDLHIADGHHSHICALLKNPKAEVIIYRTNLHANRLINVLNKLKVTVKDEL